MGFFGIPREYLTCQRRRVAVSHGKGKKPEHRDNTKWNEA
jgi:hypothetical protein